MSSVLTELALAVALALQPWSIIASVVLVTSTNGRRKAACFVLGWTAALCVVAFGTAALAPATAPTSATSRLLSWVDLVAGLLLGLWAVALLRRSPARGPGHTPGWMRRVDTMSPLAALVLGAFLPNYVLVVAAVSGMVESGRSSTSLVVAAAVFVLVASLGVAAPLLVIVLRGPSGPEICARWRTWLTVNGGLVMLCLLGMVSLWLMAKGLKGLLT